MSAIPQYFVEKYVMLHTLNETELITYAVFMK